MSETPILGMTEMNNAQSQPEVVVNAAIRALEIFGQLIVIDIYQESPPGSVADGDAYILGQNLTGDWAAFPAFSVVYYSAGWQNLIPKDGWLAYVLYTGSSYRYIDDGSPPWVIEGGAGAVDAHDDVGYTPQGSPLFSPAPSSAGDALDDLFGMIDLLENQIVDVEESIDALDIPEEAHELPYTPVGSPIFSPTPTNTGDALDDIFRMVEALDDVVSDLLRFGVPYSQPGSPGAGAIYNIVMVSKFVIPSDCAGSYGYSGTNATADAVFTLKKNGVEFGSVTFKNTGAVVFANPSPVTFQPSDRLTITAPGSQDATLANVGFTLRCTRSL